MSQIDWIDTNSLREVFKDLNTLCARNQQPVPGDIMAAAVNRLTKCEVTPGGPYKNELDVVDVETNMLIDDFLCFHGVVLPNLEKFRAKSSLPTSTSSTDELTEIHVAIDERSKKIPTSIYRIAKPMINNIMTSPKKREIPLLSRYFAASLSHKRIKDEEQKITMLGAANVYTWVAYTIFDDFYDDEGSTETLPVAIYFSRLARDLYLETYSNKESRVLIDRVFEAMDSANLWEIRHARAKTDNKIIHIRSLPSYGRYKVLALRAGAHILGPRLIALNCKDLNSLQQTNITKGLEQFLIARQLNDDIHDWYEDFTAGHLSPVVTSLLEKAGAANASFEVARLAKKLEKSMWTSEIEKLCHKAEGVTSSSIEHLRNSQHILDNSQMINLVTNLQKAMIACRTSHENNKQFLSTYKSLVKD